MEFGGWRFSGALELDAGAYLSFCFAFRCSQCSPPATNPAPARPIFPSILTCDVHGRPVPCGCFSGQFGGLTWLKTVLDSEAPPNALRLDAGDAIGGHEDYDVIQYHYLLRAFATAIRN